MIMMILITVCFHYVLFYSQLLVVDYQYHIWAVTLLLLLGYKIDLDELIIKMLFKGSYLCYKMYGTNLSEAVCCTYISWLSILPRMLAIKWISAEVVGKDFFLNLYLLEKNSLLFLILGSNRCIIYCITFYFTLFNIIYSHCFSIWIIHTLQLIIPEFVLVLWLARN